MVVPLQWQARELGEGYAAVVVGVATLVVVAAALAGNLLASDTQFAASGFRDTTRIASGDPGLWIPILSQNNDAVRQALAQLQTRLEEFSDALQHDDNSALQKLLEEAKRQRDGLD
mgnify:CR=1 FL=1